MNLYKLTLESHTDFKNYETYCVASNPQRAEETIMEYLQKQHYSTNLFVSNIQYIAQLGKSIEYKAKLLPLFISKEENEVQK